jgi:hypothetical protein
VNSDEKVVLISPFHAVVVVGVGVQRPKDLFAEDDDSLPVQIYQHHASLVNQKL